MDQLKRTPCESSVLIRVEGVVDVRVLASSFQILQRVSREVRRNWSQEPCKVEVRRQVDPEVALRPQQEGARFARGHGQERLLH
jgi:hypothetical protein